MTERGEKLYWWMKKKHPNVIASDVNAVTPVTPQVSDRTDSLMEFLDKEQKFNNEDDSDTDIGSIIDEINKIAAQSPLGPFDKDTSDRSIEDIIREAEKLYINSSKSFEQLNLQSKLLQLNDRSNSVESEAVATPTNISPLPLDDVKDNNDSKNSDSYNEDFQEESPASDSNSSVCNVKNNDDVKKMTTNTFFETNENIEKITNVSDEVNEKVRENKNFQENNNELFNITNMHESERNKIDHENNIESKLASNNFCEKKEENSQHDSRFFLSEVKRIENEINKKEEAIQLLDNENKQLKRDLELTQIHLKETRESLETTKSLLEKKNAEKSPKEIEKLLEELRDSKEINTALQLQLENVNTSYNTLKISYENVTSTNKMLEKRVSEAEELLRKYKNELINVQKHRDRLIDSETNLNHLLETERIQNKALKTQNDKDSKCILDLNRQIKEMERIITRKQPDSVSALIVAAKYDESDLNPNARKVLEDRIRCLETEVYKKDYQSSTIFAEVQDKFNQMKAKYESHIEDLELHVCDLKNQLKKNVEIYDVYTQTTFLEEQKIPEKETKAISSQTDLLQRVKVTDKRVEKKADKSSETHLLATIRGLQTDLLNKERAIVKLNKELEEQRKTNRRLQKEREGSLKNLSERREFRSYPEKLAVQIRSSECSTTDLLEEELKNVKNDRDKLRQQLYRMEEDYHSLREKRLQDLTTLQDAHERELSTYLSNIAPLQEQLEVQQLTINSLQNQLKSAKEELAVISIERDHFSSRLNGNVGDPFKIDYISGGDGDKAESAMSTKISLLEKTHVEREQRLRSIILGLAQKNVMNMNCEQCAIRQKQLIMYKNELDQLLITLRAFN